MDEKLDLNSDFLHRSFETHDGNYLIRPLYETDRNYVLDLFNHLSSESRYFRYAHYLSTLPESLLNRILDAHHVDDLALGAFLINDNLQEKTLLGIARYVKESSSYDAEFSLSVSDDFHHEKIGTNLMLALLDCAKNNGFLEIHGYVLSENNGMIGLMNYLGAKHRKHIEDNTVLMMSFDL